MIKEIKYSEITTVPPDNTCSDGDAALLLNLIPEDGALKPVMPPKEVMALQDKMHITYIHKTTSFRHYIIHDDANKKLVWTSDGKTFSDLYTLGDIPLHQVNAIGNTLMALTKDGTHYFLWDNAKQSYKHLGTHLPELPITFGLKGEVVKTEEFNVDLLEREDVGEDSKVTFGESNTKKVTNEVLAKVNKFIEEESVAKGRFIFPFFVRYAFRLYDGSLTMHSAPILMQCSTKVAPEVLISKLSIKDGHKLDNFNYFVTAALCKLDYQISSSSALRELENWKDIVKSVDIFISKPIYTYDQNGKCTGIENINSSNANKVHCLLINGAKGIEYTTERTGNNFARITEKHTDARVDFSKYQYYQEHNIYHLYAMAYPKTDREGGEMKINSTRVVIPRIKDDKLHEEIKSVAHFYLLNSIRLNDLLKVLEVKTTERTELRVKEDYLQSLITREVMSDDYDSHDILCARYSFNYNARVNICGIKKRLFKGFSTTSMIQYCNGYMPFIDNDNDRSHLSYAIAATRAWVHINRNGKEFVLPCPMGEMSEFDNTYFLYYPNTDAYKITVDTMGYGGWRRRYEFPLEKHNFLNGAFFFSDFETMDKYIVNKDPLQEDTFLRIEELTSQDEVIELPNKIYTSEVNNPFFFPLSGINTIGTGEIKGICSAVKALSEGQFGQFPLYAFTDEGVWALEVSNTGTYIARQPITRDICIAAKSLTQIDSAVLFATERGIMLLQGSQAICISDVLNGDNIVPLTALPKIDKILSHIELEEGTLKILPFMEFVKECRMIYNYEHQRIIVYNIKCKYAYVWSLKSKMWGMMQSNIADNVNSYPDALAVLTNGSLVNFSDVGDAKEHGEHSLDGDNRIDKINKNLLISRPIKLDYYDIHKSVDAIIPRGVFRHGHVKSILYASNDLFNWVPVWSSVDHYMRGFRGTPYKYLRIILLTELSKDEGITSCLVQFTPRLNNQPR